MAEPLNIDVTIQADYLRRLTRTRPVMALAELIWNGLDADAQTVRVEIEDNGLSGIRTLRVVDDGHGIDFAKVEALFSKLGGSWKEKTQRSPTLGRVLHGQVGHGRFRAFALGHRVTWRTVYKASSGSFQAYTIAASEADPRRFVCSQTEDVNARRTGTTVEITNSNLLVSDLTSSAATGTLDALFATYLKNYNVDVIVHAHKLDPSSSIDDRTSISLGAHTDGQGVSHEAELEIVEWKAPRERSIYLCDKDGFVLAKRPYTIRTPGFEISGYVKSQMIRNAYEAGTVDLDFTQGLQPLIDKVQVKTKEHFKIRDEERDTEYLEQLKAEGSYPYSDEDKSPPTLLARSAFDLVATTVARHAPWFLKSDLEARKLALSLMKTALAGDAQQISKILMSVMKLPKAKAEDLSELMDAVSLETTIELAQRMARRVELLRGLKYLILDPNQKFTIAERNQLHPIVAKNCWLFGEEFALSLSEAYLDTVVKQTLKTMGVDETKVDPVRKASGGRGRIDLLLSSELQGGVDRKSFLIVELKAPDVTVGKKEYDQVREYASALARSSSFVTEKTEWTFVLVGRKFDAFVEDERHPSDRPVGCAFRSSRPQYTVWVKSWAEVFNDNEARLKNFIEGIDRTQFGEESIELIKKLYARYLPRHMSVLESVQ